ncbi:hypothetical protein GQX73_g10506 [Xylaria multiplex]|uniref:Peptidase M10 metallopeptidase domain-containing protein n=1 Tax=Xylaria multiplex TaxID=323545 RepID=A0A7C8MLH5_9PEZI|nr:hypothetical protein GQX73_g10506 [Xylaria multiplex]
MESILLPYNIPSPTERQHHVDIAPQLTARAGNAPSENNVTGLSRDADNDDGGSAVITPPTYWVRPSSQSMIASPIITRKKDQEVWNLFNIPQSSNLLIGIDSYGEPSVGYNSDLGAEGDGHQARIAVSGSPVPAFVDYDQLSPRGADYYHCATQQRADGIARAQIGIGKYIPRWCNGATVTYVILDESFEKPDDARFTAVKVAEAISMWKSIGVKFEQVHRSHPATFQIRYLDLPFNTRPDVYAEAFFPQDGRGTLFVYELAFQAANMQYLANILAHEFGHILGLRHDFAGDIICKVTGETRESGSVRWGRRNRSSVMNYFTDLRQYSVKKQDLEELRSFYDFTEEKYKGRKILKFTPGRYLFPISGGTARGQL